MNKSSYQEFQAYLAEVELRKKYPAVQEAWEKYQLLVNLYQSTVPKKDIDETQFG
jgi:acyl-homoserine lactone acylase PvdQ